MEIIRYGIYKRAGLVVGRVDQFADRSFRFKYNAVFSDYRHFELIGFPVDRGQYFMDELPYFITHDLPDDVELAHKCGVLGLDIDDKYGYWLFENEEGFESTMSL